jgi:hypothetical protein
MTFDDHTQSRAEQDAELLRMTEAYHRQQADSAERVRRYRLAIRRIDAMLIATAAFATGGGVMFFLLKLFNP